MALFTFPFEINIPILTYEDGKVIPKRSMNRKYVFNEKIYFCFNLHIQDPP